MIPQVVTVGPLAASNASLFAASQTPVSGTALTLTGTSADVARRVLLSFGNEAAARTLALVGTSQNGNVIKETLTTTSGAPSTIATIQDFLTVTSAIPGGGGWSAAATLGTNTVASSPWNVVDYHLTPMNLAIAIVFNGTVNAGIEYTYDDINKLLIGGNSGFQAFKVPTVFQHSVLQNLAANLDGAITEPIWAWRLKVNSGAVSPASVTATAIQAGMVQG